MVPNALRRCPVVFRVQFKPDVAPPAIQTSYRRGSRTYAVVQNQFTRVCVGTDQVFEQRHRLLRWVNSV